MAYLMSYNAHICRGISSCDVTHPYLEDHYSEVLGELPHAGMR